MPEFIFEPQNATLCCVFSGRMDSFASMEADKEIAARLQGACDQVPADALSVVFDMSNVSYIASAFVRICLQTAKSVAPGRFSVTRTSPFVMKIFVMTGLDKQLNVS